MVIHLDWKATGDDLLHQLQENYAEESFCQSAEFKTLSEALANENIEQCLEPLADFLLQHKRYLLNVNTDSDEYVLLVSTTSNTRKNDAFVKKQLAEFFEELIEEEGEDAVIPESYELIKGKKKPLIKKILSATKPPKKSFPWIEDSFDYADYPSGVFENGVHVARLRKPDQEEEYSYFALDYSQWPPTETDLFHDYSDTIKPETLSFLGFLSGEAFFVRQERDKTSSRHTQRFIQTFGTLQQGKWQRWGEAIDLRTTDFDELRIFHDSLIITREENNQISVQRATDSALETIYVTGNEHEVAVYPLGTTDILIVTHSATNSKEAFFSLWHEPTKSLTARHQHFPFPPIKRGFPYCALYDSEFLYFYVEEKPHPEISSYTESFLWACRVNVIKQTYRVARLEDFEGTQKLDTRITTDRAKHSILYHSVSGYLYTRKGHLDWWLWNLCSDAFGNVTLFWFWNEKTSEVIKVTNKNLKLDCNEIVYAPALDRYINFSGSYSHLLAPFKAIHEACGNKHRITWSNACPLPVTIA